jgi:hypothetical protein
VTAAGSVPRRLNTSISKSNLESMSIAAESHFFSPSTSIRDSSAATRDGSAVGGSACASESVCV